MAAGTYHETVNVNKSVVLQSATLHGAILDPDDGAGNNDGFVVTAGSVTIEGFTIIDADDPILVWFTSDMTNIVIKHNEIDNSLGLPSGGTSGIAFASATVAPHSAAGAVVKGNIISNTHQRNAITFDGLTGDFTIHGNSISNSGFGIAVSGLDNSGTPTFKRVNVAGTVIQKNIVQNVTKAWAAGILLAGLDGGVQVIRNTLSVAGTGNDGLGLQVGSNFYKWFPGGGPDGANSYCTDVGAHANNFVGNTFAGVFNKYNPPGTSDEINARSNWWGDPSGPSGVGPGSGDAVYTNVLYKPWRKKALP